VTRFADTSFWFGLFTAKDSRHEAAARLWQETDGRIMTTSLVLGETWTLLRRRRTTHARAIELVDAIRSSPRVEIVAVRPVDEARAWDWLRTRDEREYSYVDATSFVVMHARRLTEALAFGGDFAAAGFVEVRP
jgi:predicted nucleic acid-binding protein